TANAKILDGIAEQSAAYSEYAELLRNALIRTSLPPAQRMELRRRLAVVAGEQLGEMQLAAEQLEALSGESELSPEETRRLSRYYEKLGESQKLVSLLQTRVRGETDEKSKKRLALRLASLQETQADNAVEAFETYWKAHEQEPQRIDHLQGIARTAPQAGRY